MITTKNSEIISAFLNLLRTACTSCSSAGDSQHIEDLKTSDILHKLELENLNYKERAKLATQLATIRKDRRKYKDEYEEYIDIANFAKDNEKLIHQLEKLLGSVRKIEKYHSERQYVPRMIKE